MNPCRQKVVRRQTNLEVEFHHGKGAAWELDRGRAPKVVVKERRVEGGAHEHHFEGGPPREEVAEDHEEEVRLDAPLVHLMKGGRRD